MSAVFGFAGRTAIVTGAGRGIGRAIVSGLLAAGARVSAVTLSEASAASLADYGAPEQLAVIRGDVRDQELAGRTVQETLERWGGIDILVNNAGGVVQRAPLRDWTVEQWDSEIDLTLRSAFLFAHAAEAALRASSCARVVSIASMLSFFGGLWCAPYAAAKGGIAQLTKALSNEWSGDGITVNAVAPGYIATDGNKALRDGQPERAKQISGRIPMGRWGDPQDIVGIVLFLCSEAAQYITGAVIPVDGGYSAW